jgi:glycosyltransferase involved in cell wall biosynthesis
MGPALSVVVPLYDEEESVDRIASEFVPVISSFGGRSEILLVNDGSTDATGRRARDLAARVPQVRLLENASNLGKGAALKKGLLAARGDLVFWTDADLPAAPDCLPRFVRQMENADVVVGYWTDRRESWRRNIFSRVYQGLLRLLFAVPARNVNCPAKLWRCEPVRRLARGMRARSVFVDAEMLLGARRLGLRIVECPVHYRPRIAGRSKLGSVTSALHTLLDLAVYLVGHRPSEAPLERPAE